MKQTPQLDKVQSRMQPGVLSLTGHLGTDKRKLIDIISEDEAELARLGVTKEIIASKLRELRNLGLKSLEVPVEINGLEIYAESYRGRVQCPFKDCSCMKTNITVKDLKTGKTLKYSDESIHLIEEHCFFQGKGSEYRLEPSEVVKLLKIKAAD